MSAVKETPFLVIGGGIGGLAAALSVADTGRPVVVLEQASQFGEVGAGLQLGPNAMAVLDRFGLFEAISEYAVFPKRLVLKDAITGDELSALDLGETFRERYGYPYAVMHRSDLHTVLLEACRENNLITLENNKAVVHVENQGERVRAGCEDGSTYLTDAVVGADGLWSKTRKLLIEDEPVCSEYVAYRGTIPTSEVESLVRLDDVVMWIGPYLHLVQYPVRRKELFNQVAVFKSFKYKPNSDDWGTPEELDETFSKCHPMVQNSITYMNRGFRWPMYDRSPIDNWTDGNLTLLGDAAHPMLQYLAQGACQALEDAACLNLKLYKYENDVNRAFLEYQEERIPRTAKVQTNARIWGDFLHTEDPIALILREKILTGRSATDYSHVDWLYERRQWQPVDNRTGSVS